jgi:very-short-patch-repair endonuclease
MKTYTTALIPRAREMRSNMTEPEKLMWYQCLKHLPHRFRRQRPFGPYIVDFYCASLKLVIEIDGDSHTTDDAITYDAERTTFLEGLELRVIRFSNDDVMNNIDGVYQRLKETLPPSIPPIS